jgi:hypothetical protein
MVNTPSSLWPPKDAVAVLQGVLFQLNMVTLSSVIFMKTSPQLGGSAARRRLQYDTTGDGRGIAGLTKKAPSTEGAFNIKSRWAKKERLQQFLKTLRYGSTPETTLSTSCA